MSEFGIAGMMQDPIRMPLPEKNKMTPRWRSFLNVDSMPYLDGNFQMHRLSSAFDRRVR